MELELMSCIKTEKTNTAITSTSYITSNSTFLEKSNYIEEPEDTSNMSVQELELKILSKQALKCYLN